MKPGELAEVLLRLWRAGADGVVEVRGREGERSLWMLRGAPVAFESDAPGERLGRWLAEGRHPSEVQYRAALEALGIDAPPEAAALAVASAIGTTPAAAMRAHLCAMIARLIRETEGPWRFRPGSEFQGEVTAVEVPALAPLLDGVRAALPARHFARALEPWLERYPALTPDFVRLAPDLALARTDSSLALALSGEVTARAFLEARRGGLREGLSLLWFLERAGALAFHEAPVGERLGSGPSFEGARLRTRQPLPEERAAELRRAALDVLGASYFGALGLGADARAPEVESAYRAAASRLHPDALGEFEIGPLEDLLSQVQDKLRAACRVLSDDEARQAYLSLCLGRAGAP